MRSGTAETSRFNAGQDSLLCELVGETEHGFGFAVLLPRTLFVRCPPFVMISLGWVIHSFVFQQVLFAKLGREGRMSFKPDLQNSL